MQTIKIEVDISAITSKDASELCEYIADYLIKHYNVVNLTYSVNGRE